MRTRRTVPAAAAPALALVLALALALVACSSGDDSSGTTTTKAKASSAGAQAQAIARANAVCRAGKKRTAAIVPGPLVVADPSTPEQEAATAAWSKKTAAALDATSAALAEVEATGPAKATVKRASDGYRLAAQRLESGVANVLGDKNFLSDQELYDAGLTDCFAPIKPAVTTTAPPTTTG